MPEAGIKWTPEIEYIRECFTLSVLRTLRSMGIEDGRKAVLESINDMSDHPDHEMFQYLLPLTLESIIAEYEAAKGKEDA